MYKLSPCIATPKRPVGRFAKACTHKCKSMSNAWSMTALARITDSTRTSRHVRKVPIGDIKRSLELKEVANRGLIYWHYPTVVSAGPLCELNDFRADGCLKKKPTRRSGPFLFTCRCRSFGRTAPWDFCHLLQEPDSAGPVSDHHRAADPASDPTLIWLTGLILVRHGVSFHGNAPTTARSSGSFLTKTNVAHNAATISA